MICCRPLVLAIGGTLLLGSVHAQSVTGRISGTVSDSSRAVVRAATVTVIHEATRSVRTARTDDVGFYVVTNLPPGDYTVSVEHRAHTHLRPWHCDAAERVSYAAFREELTMSHGGVYVKRGGDTVAAGVR